MIVRTACAAHQHSTEKQLFRLQFSIFAMTILHLPMRSPFLDPFKQILFNDLRIILCPQVIMIFQDFSNCHMGPGYPVMGIRYLSVNQHLRNPAGRYPAVIFLKNPFHCFAVFFVYHDLPV